MSDDSLARNPSAMLSSVDASYGAIHATIVATERGRWFLEEYARRNRASDTGLVLAAIERIERAIRGGSTATPASTPGPDLAAIVETLNQARADLLARHGDPAASGEAALADFRNAVEQIQELVWEMHGRDTGSEFGSQLSLETNRLTGAGDRIEHSLSGLRVLLGLLDDLDRRLSQLVGAPPASASAPVASVLHDEPRQAGTVLAEPVEGYEVPQPTTRFAAVEPEIALSLPGNDCETAAPASSDPELQPKPIGSLTGDDGPEPQRPPATTQTPEQFEPLWKAPDALSGALDTPIEADAGPISEAADAGSVVVSDDTQSMANFGVGGLPPQADLPPNSQPGPMAPSMPVPERFEDREYGRPAEAAQAAEADPVAEPSAKAAMPLESSNGLDDLLIDAAPAPAEPSEAVESEAVSLSTVGPEPREASSERPAAIEWFEVPAADAAGVESIFDADLFDHGHDTGAAAALSFDEQAGEAVQDEERILEGAELPAEKSAAEDLDWLIADDSADALEPATEPATAAAEPGAMQASFADPASVPDDSAPIASLDLDSTYLDEASPEPGPEQPEPVSLPDGASGSPAPTEMLPTNPTAVAALYTETSFADPAPSMGAYANRAYAQHMDTEITPAESRSTTPTAYDWPTTFARETTEGPAVSSPSVTSQASAAYHALQVQSLHIQHTLPAAATPPEAPASETAPPAPFAEEDSDVPSVMERLENVRSAIAALMEEVSEKNLHRDLQSSDE